MENNRIITILLSAVLTIVACIAFMYKINRSDNYCRHINVEGTAECDVVADIAEWSVYFEHVGENQAALSKLIEIEKPKVLNFLTKHGILEQDIEFYNYIKEDNHPRHFKENDNGIQYRMGYCVKINTKKVDTVADLKNRLFELCGDNINIVRNTLELKYSKQEEVEQMLYKEAVKNAWNKANDVVFCAKLKLKSIMKIDTPRFNIVSYSPECDMISANFESMRLNPYSSNSVQSMKKKKIKAYINLEIGIK